MKGGKYLGKVHRIPMWAVGNAPAGASGSEAGITHGWKMQLLAAALSTGSDGSSLSTYCINSYGSMILTYVER